jgi:acid stress-induced BolA-like protein IbaG/YrbA
LGYNAAMGAHLTTFEGSVTDAIREAVEAAIEGADVKVGGGGGHFTVSVTSAAFDGKSMLQRHRMVLSSIKHLMAGDQAPVHAVDKVETLLP